MPTSEAQRRATKKYEKENYDQINFSVPKGDKEKIKNRANEMGISMQAYLQKLIKNDIENE